MGSIDMVCSGSLALLDYGCCYGLPRQATVACGYGGGVGALKAFGADKMVPVTSNYNHLVTSFGLKMMKPVFDLMQQLIDAGAVSQQQFSVDPRPLDKNVPANFLQNLIFNKIMYATQDSYEEQLRQLGLMNDNAF